MFREKRSCLISKVSRWMWTPCWHVHSTWAITDRSEYNLHNYSSSSPMQLMLQTLHSVQNSHDNAPGKEMLNVGDAIANAICIEYGMMVTVRKRHKPPIPLLTHTYTLTLNTSSSWNAQAKGENLTACERWPKFLCSYCTYLSWFVFCILSQ